MIEPDAGSRTAPWRVAIDPVRRDRGPTLDHISGLDGLRGVAVVAVLLFHAGHLQGGFLGVDLFFTLSGFLITSLLLVERERSGRILLRRFWVRRARRLLPAMLVVVLAAAVLARSVLRADELDRFRTQALSALGYVANWAEVVRSRDYFALFDNPTPLEHVWSLAIEEQFYVVWPLLVLGAARLARPRTGVRALVAVGIGASLLTTWLVLPGVDGVTRAYYGTDTRAASILVGAGLATITAGIVRVGSRTERAATVLAGPALVGLVASWFVVDGSELWLYRWGLFAHAVLTAVVIAGVSGPLPGVLARILSNRQLVRVGVLSYGLYLWHWPVYVALDDARTGLDGWTLTLLRVAVTLAAAELSFRLVESPIRRHGVPLPRPVLATIGAVAATALAVVALSWPGPDRPLPPVAPLPTVPTTTVLPDDGSPTSTTLPPDLSSVVVVGDSQAFTLAFHAPGDELGVRVENAANLGCGLSMRSIVLHDEIVVRERCLPVLAELPAQVAAADADVVAVLAGVWESSDQVTDDGVVPFGDPAWEQLLHDDFVTTVGPLSRDHDVVLLTTPCFAPGSQREEYAQEDIDARIAAVNEVFTAAAVDLGIEVVDLAGLLCPDGQPRSELDGYVVRPDGVHFDEVGARVVWPWLAIELRDALAELDR